jgi:hypothetical protein
LGHGAPGRIEPEISVTKGFFFLLPFLGFHSANH